MTRLPLREEDYRRPFLSPRPVRSCPIYGPRSGYRYQAHALYVAWTMGQITAKRALSSLRHLPRP